MRRSARWSGQTTRIGCCKNIGRLCRSGGISRMSQKTLSGEQVSNMHRPYCPVASPVSRSVLPGSEKARRMTVISGRKCLEWCRNSGPLGLLERMLLGSSAWHSMMCVLTWKVSVTPAGRSLFRLRASVPRTCEIGYSLWPTPVAMQADRPLRPLAPSEKTLNHGVMLCAAVYDSLQEGPIRIWPTPTSCTGHNVGRLDEWGGSQNPLRGMEGSNGLLNPVWVEWLMGLPLNWTSLEDW